MTLQGIDISTLDSNAWLTGFIEGDGSYYISGNSSYVYGEITQSRID